MTTTKQITGTVSHINQAAYAISKQIKLEEGLLSIYDSKRLIKHKQNKVDQINGLKEIYKQMVGADYDPTLLED